MMDRNTRISGYGIGLILYGSASIVFHELFGLSSIRMLESHFMLVVAACIVIGVAMVYHGIRNL
jgi:hypothetical protein